MYHHQVGPFIQLLGPIKCTWAVFPSPTIEFFSADFVFSSFRLIRWVWGFTHYFLEVRLNHKYLASLLFNHKRRIAVAQSISYMSAPTCQISLTWSRFVYQYVMSLFCSNVLSSSISTQWRQFIILNRSRAPGA